MSDGFGPSWVEDDAATFGEGIARCARLECCAPLRVVTGFTIVVVRCEFGHILSLHPVVEPTWTTRD